MNVNLDDEVAPVSGAGGGLGDAMDEAVSSVESTGSSIRVDGRLIPNV
jgi:hypothetical protein